MDTWKYKLTRANFLLALLCFCSLFIPVTHAAGDDPPIDVIQPEQLVIQLGPQWAGVEFQMKTDYGLYPGSIPVDSDGVLRLEIGGSSQYLLSCLNSGTPIPQPEERIPEQPPESMATEPIPTQPEPSVIPSSPEKPQNQNLSLLLAIQALVIAALTVAVLTLYTKNLEFKKASARSFP